MKEDLNESKSKMNKAKELATTRNLVTLIIFVVFVVILFTQFDKFKMSFSYIKHIDYTWLILGLVFSLLTFVMSAMSYYALAKSPIKFGRTILSQGASMFANHLFPAGIGSLGVGYSYLRKNNHTKSEAATVVYINNLLGFIGYLLIIFYLAIFTRFHFKYTLNFKFNYFVAAFIVFVLALSLYFVFKSTKLKTSIKDFMGQLKLSTMYYKDHKIKLIISLLSIMSLTFLYAFSLYSCVRAVGLNISVAEALIVLAISVIGKSITPTPGGIIGAEAGLFAGLIAYGATSPQALIIVITYRLVTYWAPFGIGAIAFAIVRKKDYI